MIRRDLLRRLEDLEERMPTPGEPEIMKSYLSTPVRSTWRADSKSNYPRRAIPNTTDAPRNSGDK